MPLLLAVLVAAGLALTAEPRQLIRSLQRFDLRLLMPVLGLSLVNYWLRYLRWDLYLRRLGVALAPRRSLAVFVVGFLLSVTPGKAGELGKAWLARELGGGPALRVVPVVLAERVTDVLGTVLLIALGALPLPGGGWIAAAGCGGVAVATLILLWQRGAERIFALLQRLPAVRSRVHPLRGMYAQLRSLFSAGLLLSALSLATLAWAAEGVGFYLLVRDYTPEADLLLCVFNYTAATVLGGLSMLPGGLGAAEGSLAALLHGQGLDSADASSITLLTRGATLWFAVFLGFLALPFVIRWLAMKNAATQGSQPPRCPSNPRP